MGDDSQSWAIDLFRLKAWHQRPTGYCSHIIRARLSHHPQYLTQPAYDINWIEGDIIQCYLDCDKKEMSFGHNGTFIGLVFDDVEIGDGLYPAMSTNFENEITFNFGDKPFRYL